MNLAFDLEEMVEDMFVGYLRSVLPGDIKVFWAFNTEKIQYPCVIVSTGDTSQATAGEDFDNNQKIPVMFEIYVEAPEKDSGRIIGSIRDMNRKVRRVVLGALCLANLKEVICPFGPDGLGISKAKYAGAGRSADSGNRLMVTKATVNVIACPVET